LHGKQGVFGDQPFLEGAVLPTAADPDLACGQPDAQLRQDAKFIMAPVRDAPVLRRDTISRAQAVGAQQIASAGNRIGGLLLGLR
jgi:hypothetical protein